ncbi:MAG: sulfite reductase subunit alpha [Puniceicoccaceae bacterium]
MQAHPDSTQTHPFIPDNAPFSAEQRAWLNGFLAGIYSNSAAEPKAPATPVTLLWGSQTGNCETLARKTGKRLKKAGFDVKVIDMSSYDVAKLANEQLLLILTSTYGDGEAPDNAQAFQEYLHSDQAHELSKVNFAVLALGDSSYPHFCKAGIDMDQRLKVLGAKRLIERVDCDADYEASFDAWLHSIEQALQPFQSSTREVEAADADDDETEEPLYHRKNPFPSTVVESRLLNGEGSSKEVRHVCLDLADSGLKYEAGDAIGIFPQNCPELVDQLLEKLELSAGESVTHAGQSRSLHDVLLNDCEISQLSRPTLAACHAHSPSAKLAELLEDSNSEQLKHYIAQHHFIDLIDEIALKVTSGADLLKILPSLQPRLYSISSSPRHEAGKVTITVGAVRYTLNGTARKGVASTFLADRVSPGESVPVFFHPNRNFRLPEDDKTPVIMVGPGTGIAPFRSFLQEREARAASGPNWLFFGDQHAATDFLYAEELRRWQEQGLLTHLNTAFSRDQADKRYVQHEMLEAAETLFEWLEAGAHFYVCGDASRMAKDVDAALVQIVTQCGKFDNVSGKAYVDQLKRERRYQRDVY